MSGSDMELERDNNHNNNLSAVERTTPESDENVEESTDSDSENENGTEKEEEEDDPPENDVVPNVGVPTVFIHEGKNLVERSKFILIRLSEEERDLLRILEGGLEISEYTDKVDVSSSMYGSYWSMSVNKKVHLIERELKTMLGFISGLYVAYNYSLGGKLVNKDANQDFQANEEFFQRIFEIGRRYKIMNPDKMRTTFGKLMYIAQDAVMPGTIDFNVHSDIFCVYTFLKNKNSLSLLDDPDIIPATQCVVSAVRQDIETEIKTKTIARQNILNRHISDQLSREDILLVIESLSDSNSYILSNRHPVDMMIHYLKSYFSKNNNDKRFSLAIYNRVNGSCLSHDHSTRVGLTPLGRSSYRLEDTGQGLQRVQSAPHVSHTMSSILQRVKSRVGSWVGLSVVHLGDRDVPNALIFIDKYTQVPRILAPIVRTIERIGELEHDPLCGQFIEEMGGVHHLRKTILCDFFKHGFDGSGDDGGSCVDGRLTSAWNWTAQIEKKSYYPIFLLCGFSGFDGSFRK